MDARQLVRSKFMVSHEFGSGDIPKEPLVTIADVKKPDEEDETTKGWWLIHFAEVWAKPLKVNRTHQQALILMFGGETNDWKGKRVGLTAVQGTFFGRRQTAVRIKGSPDLKAPCSFSVRKFGGGSDTYNLVVLAGPSNGKAAKPATPPAPFVPDGTLKFKIGALKGTQLMQLQPSELAEAIAFGKKWIADHPGAPGQVATQGHVAELEADQQRRAKLEEQMNASAPPELAPPGTDETAPF